MACPYSSKVEHTSCKRTTTDRYRIRAPLLIKWYTLLMRFTNICTHCDRPTNNPKFCSQSCAASFNNTTRVRKTASYTGCLACGKKVLPHRVDKRYCTNKCADKYGDYIPKSLLEFIEGRFGTKTIGAPYTHIREYVLASQDGVCAICECEPTHNGSPLTFVLDHIDGNSDNNLPDNIRLVCPNCDSQLPTFKSRNIGNGRHYRRVRYAEGRSF